MGARGRVPSRARRPARVGASSRALARRRSAAPYAVVAAVGRDASFRTTTDRARPGGAESKFDPLVSSAHARARVEALRTGPARPERGGARVASRRDAARWRLRCVALHARSVLPGWESGRAGRTVGSRCAPGGCSCARAGGERCTCTYRGPGSRVAAGRHRRRAVPLCRFSPWPCHVWFSPSLIGFSHAFRAVEWQASAYRSCTGPPGSYLICT